MYKILRPLLFKLEPELTHALTLHALRITGSLTLSNLILKLMYRTKPNPVEAFGFTFKNPVGLAAGYDKNAIALAGLSSLGFGHIEVGTVTPLAQEGNPKPRVFRLTEDEAVINRMGFPNYGADYVKKRLKPIEKATPLNKLMLARWRSSNIILGINLGKNKSTPNEEAVLDYLSLMQLLSEYADYLTINISSPNTVGLRDLQGKKALESLLHQIDAQRKIEEKQYEKKIPVLVKLAPDLTESELYDAIDVIIDSNMDGIIVNNTTLSRDGVESSLRIESGGLSGKPLRGKSEAVLHQTVKHVNGKIPIVSVGGIMNPDDVKRRLDAGATLIQIYTGLIYEGPSLVKKILKKII
ncbi:MAG: quinone-dependent dihydroorotate dehydrogenase [Anaerolineales bacterium]|nr:quinone-dependent dihydroorotate dehydrogenase [Anaerolineales bacterium]